MTNKSILSLMEKMYNKPFKYNAVPELNVDSSSVAGTTYISKGVPWIIRVYAIDLIFPQELFKTFDLHSRAKEEGFIGWITGTIVKGRKAEEGRKAKPTTLFVDEIQSDLMQRTFQLTSEEMYRKAALQKLYTSSKEWHDKIQELIELEKEFSGSGAYPPLKKKYEIQQRMDELSQAVKNATSKVNMGGVVKGMHPEFQHIKSKLENTYKKWIESFFNSTIDLAREQGADFMAIISSSQFGRSKEEGSNLFVRAYDGVAKRLGMVKWPVDTKWWVGRVNSLGLLEGKIREDIDSTQWEKNIEIFFDVFAKQQGIDIDAMPKGSYNRNEEIGQIFRFWVDTVQQDLKGDLEWREKIEDYMEKKYEVDISDMWGLAAPEEEKRGGEGDVGIADRGEDVSTEEEDQFVPGTGTPNLKHVEKEVLGATDKEFADLFHEWIEEEGLD